MSDFINPYNFIPFGDGPDRSDVHEYYIDKTKLISGWIDVLVTPKTSLIITDGKPLDKDGKPIPQNSNDKEHCHFKFFRTQDGKYAIPGSTLRGLTRSVYEAASNSCLPFVLDADDEFTMRVPNNASFKERGLIRHEDGKWILYSAKVNKCEVRNYETDIIGGKWNGLDNGQKVRFNKNAYSAKKADSAKYAEDGQYEGWLQFNIPVRITKGHYHVAFLEHDKRLKSYDDEYPYPYIAMKTALEFTVKNVEKLNKTAAKEIIAVHASLLKQLELAKNDPSVMVPVWYLKVDDQYYFSPASIGRVYHKNGWEKIAGKYAPCSQLDELCPACKLFGTTADGGTKGHLRFTDAILVDPDKAHVESVDLPILATPRPSAYEFYINRPKNATYWNYNYYSYKNDNNVAHVSVKDMMMPRGRKFYWHSSHEQTVMENNTHLNASMEAMRAGDGVAFRSRIYFDMITEKQLSQLKWVLTFGCNKVSDSHLHKIGHARPVGYGSVKMSIESIGIRKVSFSESKLCYTIDTEAVDENCTFACPWGTNTPRIKALLKMSDFNAVGKLPVDYPRISEYEREIFKWFANNRRNSYIQVLPQPTESDKGLYRDGRNAPNKDKAGNNGTQTTQDQTKKADDPNVVRAKVIRVSSGTYFELPDGSTGYMRGERTLKIGADIRVRVGEKNDHGYYDVEYA